MGNPELTAQIRNPGGPWDLRLASEVGQPCGTGPDPWGLRSLRTVRVGVEVLDSQRVAEGGGWCGKSLPTSRVGKHHSFGALSAFTCESTASKFLPKTITIRNSHSAWDNTHPSRG